MRYNFKLNLFMGFDIAVAHSTSRLQSSNRVMVGLIHARYRGIRSCKTELMRYRQPQEGDAQLTA